ncbi:MAG: serine/threonine protein kinase, partial [Holophagales bacterium]|nr:serine/threonine protein kinase [Holophagales bacterium]
MTFGDGAEVPEGTLTRFGGVLLEAAGLDSGEREALLAQVAESDPDLAAEVARRLEAEGPRDTFLAMPAAERLEAAPVTRHAEGSGSHPFEPGIADLEPPPAMTPISDRYAVGDCLGEGGMGRVFDAFDLFLRRPVALKVLSRDEPRIAARFLAEARAQARVVHDHVLEVYDTGLLHDKPFIAMRKVSGGTLGDVARRASLEGVVRLSIQAAEGLHAAHQRGLIHRDVKPSNVLVEASEEGELRAFVADFGIAIGPDEAALEERIVGTPAYLAPEVLSSG